MDNPEIQTRYFTSYSGVSLPLNLVNELEDGVQQRITYFIGSYNQERLLKVEKIVYSETEFTHDYSYDDNGNLVQAVIIEQGEDPRTLVFDAQGQASEI